MSRVLVLTKRQYMSKDLIDDRFGRFRELPKALAEMGHQVRGLCLSYRPCEEGKFLDGPVEWTSINATRFKVPGLARFLVRAYELARDSDVIWACSDSFYGMIGCLVGKLRRVPAVFDIYDNFEAFLVGSLPVLKQAYRHAVRKSDAVTCFSDRMRIRLESYGRADRTFVLENTADTRVFRPMDQSDCRKALGFPQEAVIIGTAGALYRNRGVEKLYEAFFELAKTHSTLYLAVAGPRHSDLPVPDHPRIRDLGILPHESVPCLYNALDVAVICYTESELGDCSFPYKAREIMACTVPAIAARVGSMKELYRHHPDWLYDPESSDSLAKAILNRLKDRSTDYGSIPTWEDLARSLGTIIDEVVALRREVSG